MCESNLRGPTGRRRQVPSGELGLGLDEQTRSVISIKEKKKNNTTISNVKRG